MNREHAISLRKELSTMNACNGNEATIKLYINKH